jgi:hypothetical protein
MARNLQTQQAKKETKRGYRAMATSAALQAVTQYGKNASMQLFSTPSCSSLKLATVLAVQASFWGLLQMETFTAEWYSPY